MGIGTGTWLSKILLNLIFFLHIDVIRRTLPEGVELNIHEHTEAHFEARWIPDPFLNAVQEELDEMESLRQMGELYESFGRKRALVKYQFQSEVIKEML